MNNATWTYQDKEFTSDMIEDYIGFVYEITDTANGMKYIGKKLFVSKVTKPPLKGKKNKRRSLKESDWKTYCGSNDEIKTIVETDGLERFQRRILRLCKSKGSLNYYEMYEQMINHVLLKPTEYYNAFVGSRVARIHLKGLKPEDFENK